ncbi:aminotransferase class III-fold pyridoxal phosphate-dependent enzyme [Streptomyces nogalater]
MAKTSVALIRESHYHKEFELVHSSTFAKDGFSSLVALKVLELLEADGGALYRRAGELGRKLLAALEAVRAEFPDVIKDVRGRGLMLGVEFHDRSDAGAPAIRDLARSGFLGYAVAGYLLREHSVRLFPTGSAVNTLRLEPSVRLTDDGIEQLRTALRGVCSVLRDEDGQRFLGADPRRPDRLPADGAAPCPEGPLHSGREPRSAPPGALWPRFVCAWTGPPQDGGRYRVLSPRLHATGAH